MGKRNTCASALAVLMALCGMSAAPAVAADGLEIKVLSNRADLISAGDALVEVKLPAGTDPTGVTVNDDDRDVTGSFALRDNGRFMGLVEGLDVGDNVLTAMLRDGSGSKITVTNHPNGGPVTSGPQIQPWVCQASAVDDQCNQPTVYSYVYRDSSGQFAAYDPDNPPASVPTTTTDQGKTVPYIVRLETGYQDRDQYQIASLYNPDEPWTAWDPQEGWNHKLLITHGASCGIDHQTGTAPSVMNDPALSRGFAVMSTALNNAGHNCNIATQAESMIMAKERLVEQLGEIRYTIGTGCSGGSLTQQQVANAYPGLYQGILPQCSFPDAWSTGQQLVDYHLVRDYVESPGKWDIAGGAVWDPLSIAAVEGHPNHVNSIILDELYWTSLGVPDDGCPGVPAEDNYNADTNSGGVRCALADYAINVTGPRVEERWSPAEQTLGHGFGGLPLDNVGVQYGLEALKAGPPLGITPAQFADLNSKIGGLTADTLPVPERFEADRPALANAYRSGGINKANNLDQVAIIDLRGPDPGAFHDAYRTWAVRARIEREQGHFKNHVIWFGVVPLLGDVNYAAEGMVAMDRWLAAVEADGGPAPLADKIVSNRPADLEDRCANVAPLVVEMIDVPGIGRVCELPDVQTKYGTPRTIAGEGIETDVNKCQLKPLQASDYYPTTFTAPQWAKLQAAFPTGVCDWSEPGVDMQDTIPWQTYQDENGDVIYGGEALGAVPGALAIAAGSGGPGGGGGQQPGATGAAATGLRAAALKRCKKKKPGKPRRRCRKRAKRLPV